MALLDFLSAQKRQEAAQIKAARLRLAAFLENRIKVTREDGLITWHKQKGVVFISETTPQGTVSYLRFNDPKLGPVKVKASDVSPRYTQEFIDRALGNAVVRKEATNATVLAGAMKSAAVSMADRASPERLAQIKAAFGLKGNMPFPGGWDGMIAFMAMIGTPKSGLQNLDFVETKGRGYLGVRVGNCGETVESTQKLLKALTLEITERTGRVPSFAFSDNMIPGSPILIRDRNFVDVTMVFPEACLMPRTNKPVQAPLSVRIKNIFGMGVPAEEITAARSYQVFRHRMASLSQGRDWSTVLSMRARDLAMKARSIGRIPGVDEDSKVSPGQGLDIAPPNKKPVLAPRPVPVVEVTYVAPEPEPSQDFSMFGMPADEPELKPRGF